MDTAHDLWSDKRAFCRQRHTYKHTPCVTHYTVTEESKLYDSVQTPPNNFLSFEIKSLNTSLGFRTINICAIKMMSFHRNDPVPISNTDTRLDFSKMSEKKIL